MRDRKSDCHREGKYIHLKFDVMPLMSTLVTRAFVEASRYLIRLNTTKCIEAYVVVHFLRFIVSFFILVFVFLDLLVVGFEASSPSLQTQRQ